MKENGTIRKLCKAIFLSVLVFFITYSNGNLQEVFSRETVQTHGSFESETDDLKKQLKQEVGENSAMVTKEEIKEEVKQEVGTYLASDEARENRKG